MKKTASILTLIFCIAQLNQAHASFVYGYSVLDEVKDTCFKSQQYQVQNYSAAIFELEWHGTPVIDRGSTFCEKAGKVYDYGMIANYLINEATFEAQANYKVRIKRENFVEVFSNGEPDLSFTNSGNTTPQLWRLPSGGLCDLKMTRTFTVRFRPETGDLLQNRCRVYRSCYPLHETARWRGTMNELAKYARCSEF
jgi:hypothetical protein